MTINQPLSEVEYDELDDFLMSDAVGDNSMDISMLDGFLTALVIGPNTLLPSRWLHKVWDNDDMVWETTDQASQIISLIMRHMNFLAELFMKEPESFEPMILINTFNEEGSESSTNGVRGLSKA